MLGGAGSQHLALPAGGQVVAQLGDQHRGRLLAVVAGAAPAPADVEHAARREERFEHQLAVVAAARAVAGAHAPGQRHQVEVAAARGARVVAVVHAEQADDLEGDRAHRHQAAEGHAAGAKPPGELRPVELAEPGLAGDGQRHGFVEAGRVARLEPAGECFVEGGHRQALRFVGRCHDVAHETAAALGPARGRGRGGCLPPPGDKALEQAGERSGDRGLQAADLGAGLDVAEDGAMSGRGHRPGGGTPAARIAEQHAAQPEEPGVLLAAGVEPEVGALRAVETPADAGRVHPLRQARQVARTQAEARGDRRGVQEATHLAEGAALLRHAQQPLERDGQRVAAPLLEICDRVRDVPGVGGAVLPEDGVDGRREGVDVGHHHDDVARVQPRPQSPCLERLGQQVQQLVVQDLDFALRAVGDVEDDRAVGGAYLLRRVLGERHEVADAGLHLLQKGLARAVVEEVDLGRLEALLRGHGVVEGVELAHEVASLGAPGGEQRVGVDVHVLQGHYGQVAAVAQRVAAALHAQQVPALDDVGPVVAAGVRHGKQDLRSLGQGRECFQRLHRQVARAEEDDAARDRRGRGAAGGECREEALVHLRPGSGAVALAQGGEELAPEGRLPALVLGQRLGIGARMRHAVVALRPGVEPVAAVDLVLVVEVGQALAELPAPLGVARVGSVKQKARERLEDGLVKQPGQQLHQAPGERGLVERGMGRHGVPAEDLAVGAPEEPGRQLDARRGADAVCAGQGHLEPLGRAVALHEEDFLLQGAEGVRAGPVEEGLGEELGAIAVQDEEAGLDRRGHVRGKRVGAGSLRSGGAGDVRGCRLWCDVGPLSCGGGVEGGLRWNFAHRHACRDRWRRVRRDTCQRRRACQSCVLGAAALPLGRRPKR